MDSRKLMKETVKWLLRNVAGRARYIAIRRRLRAQGLLRPTNRDAFLRQVRALDTALDTLEIGPFSSPQLRGPRVRYFDVLDSRALRQRAIELGRDAEGVPTIHHVSPEGDLAVVNDTFDIVVSSHAVEHQPDLIRHLNGVAKLLRPGGRYLLIVPDKRFTFDYFLPETSLVDVQAAADRRKVHTPEAVEAHFTRTTHNSSVRHWLGAHGRARPDDVTRRYAREAVARAARGEYVDVHAWVFSPRGFRQLVMSLCATQLIPFAEVSVHETDLLANEFFAVLTMPSLARGVNQDMNPDRARAASVESPVLPGSR